MTSRVPPSLVAYASIYRYLALDDMIDDFAAESKAKLAMMSMVYH